MKLRQLSHSLLQVVRYKLTSTPFYTTSRGYYILQQHVQYKWELHRRMSGFFWRRVENRNTVHCSSSQQTRVLRSSSAGKGRLEKADGTYYDSTSSTSFGVCLLLPYKYKYHTSCSVEVFFEVLCCRSTLIHHSTQKQSGHQTSGYHENILVIL